VLKNFSSAFLSGDAKQSGKQNKISFGKRLSFAAQILVKTLQTMETFGIMILRVLVAQHLAGEIVEKLG
jgi:hypothetical protein